MTLKENDTYIIKRMTVEKLFQMTNFNTEESFFRFSSKLRKMGIDDEFEYTKYMIINYTEKLKKISQFN